MKTGTLRMLFVTVFAMGMTACAVQELDGESSDGSSAELSEDVVAAPDEAIDVPSAKDAPSTLALPRYYLSYGSCHTFDFLREQSNGYCRSVLNNLNAFAVDRNYTYGCTGWWGNGARKVWFSCATHNI